MLYCLPRLKNSEEIVCIKTIEVPGTNAKVSIAEILMLIAVLSLQTESIWIKCCEDISDIN